jgi:hypothetical protein
MNIKSLKTATTLLKHVFCNDMISVATLVTAEAEKDASVAIHGLESLITFAQKLLKELKDD